MKYSITSLLLFALGFAFVLAWFSADRNVRKACYMTNDLGYWPNSVRFGSNDELAKWQQSIGLDRLGASPDGIDFGTSDLLIEPMDSFSQVTITSRLSDRFLFIHDAQVSPGEIGAQIHIPKKSTLFYISKWGLSAMETAAGGGFLAILFAFRIQLRRRRRSSANIAS